MSTFEFIIIAVLLFLNFRATNVVTAQCAEATKTCNTIAKQLARQARR